MPVLPPPSRRLLSGALAHQAHVARTTYLAAARFPAQGWGLDTPSLAAARTTAMCSALLTTT